MPRRCKEVQDNIDRGQPCYQIRIMGITWDNKDCVLYQYFSDYLPDELLDIAIDFMEITDCYITRFNRFGKCEIVKRWDKAENKAYWNKWRMDAVHNKARKKLGETIV